MAGPRVRRVASSRASIPTTATMISVTVGAPMRDARSLRKTNKYKQALEAATASAISSKDAEDLLELFVAGNKKNAKKIAKDKWIYLA